MFRNPRQNRSFAISAVTVLMLVLIGAPVQGDERSVIVNGQSLSALDKAHLDQLNGAPVPSGNYWVDFTTGLWGYTGGVAQGYLTAYRQAYAAQAALTQGLAQNPGVGVGQTGGTQVEDQMADFCARNGC